MMLQPNTIKLCIEALEHKHYIARCSDEYISDETRAVGVAIDDLKRALTALSTPAPEQGELLPCPFCGGEAYLDAMYPPLYEIRCADCASCGQIKTNKDEAIAAWNRRTPHRVTSDD